MKTIKVIHKPVARDLSVNVGLVELTNNYYWKEIKNKLISLNVTAIYIKELGTITASKYKLNKKIKQVIYKIRNLPNLKYKEETKEIIRNESIFLLRKLLKQRNILAKDQYEYIQRNKSNGSQSHQECEPDS